MIAGAGVAQAERGQEVPAAHPRTAQTPPEDKPMNTRTIAIAALVIAALLLLFLVILPNL